MENPVGLSKPIYRFNKNQVAFMLNLNIDSIRMILIIFIEAFINSSNYVT